MYTIILILMLVSVAVGIVSSIAITAYVSKKGIKINYILWRIKIFQYVQDYKRLTLQDEGKVGPWYHALTIGMSLTLIFALTLIILRYVFHIL